MTHSKSNMCQNGLRFGEGRSLYIIFTFAKPFSDLSCPLDGGIFMREETISMQLFHKKVKVISRYVSLLINSFNLSPICRNDILFHQTL